MILRSDAVMVESMLQWKGSIPGPAGSPYEGGVFEFIFFALLCVEPLFAPRLAYRMNYDSEVR